MMSLARSEALSLSPWPAGAQRTAHLQLPFTLTWRQHRNPLRHQMREFCSVPYQLEIWSEVTFPQATWEGA